MVRLDASSQAQKPGGAEESARTCAWVLHMTKDVGDTARSRGNGDKSAPQFPVWPGRGVDGDSGAPWAVQKKDHVSEYWDAQAENREDLHCAKNLRTQSTLALLIPVLSKLRHSGESARGPHGPGLVGTPHPSDRGRIERLAGVARSEHQAPAETVIRSLK